MAGPIAAALDTRVRVERVTEVFGVDGDGDLDLVVAIAPIASGSLYTKILQGFEQGRTAGLIEEAGFAIADDRQIDVPWRFDGMSDVPDQPMMPQVSLGAYSS